MNLMSGQFSSDMIEMERSFILNEINRKYPKGIEFGQVAVTSGRNLPCKALFHGVLAPWDEGFGFAETVSGLYFLN